MWYWQYTLIVFDGNNKNEEVSGLVVGDNIVNATETLYSYYGEDIVDIKGLKAITDIVFEFQSVTKYEKDFDFEIHKKI